jgi:SAM-dependent methyltransferase
MRPIVESASVRTRARAAATACPGCGGRELRPVYSRSGVPVHQNIAAPTQAEALRCPRGDIALAHCAECGLVFNAAFDETLVRYAPGYDASQSHSPLFGRYLDELARDLVARHSLHGKTVVEIGCGAGDFLARLCRIGAKEGIGFDPSYAGRPDRLPPGVTVRAEAYPPGRPHPPAHLVCARHVLEHIARPAAFLAALRGAAGNPDGAPVFVETPRLEWILEQHAFWDVFYEHCSYFTAPVLRRLLEAAGLAVARAGPTFGGQYQFVEARPGRPSRAPLPPDGEAPAALAARLEAFARDADTRRAEWGARLGALSRRGGCLVWGAGAKGVTFLNALDAGPDTVPAVVDLNPAKQGRYVPGTGQPIIAPSDLHRYPAGSILVMNSHYLEEIQALARVEAPGADVLSL